VDLENRTLFAGLARPVSLPVTKESALSRPAKRILPGFFPRGTSGTESVTRPNVLSAYQRAPLPAHSIDSPLHRLAEVDPTSGTFPKVPQWHAILFTRPGIAHFVIPLTSVTENMYD